MRVALLVGLLLVACSEPQPDLSYKPFDAGGDADTGPLFDPDAGDPELGKPCTDDKQCDDGIACTFDSCDPNFKRCRNHPDNTLCDDGVFCNGKELCYAKIGCEPGSVVTCDQGGGACEINRCIEATKACAHDARDVDEDTDPDDHCPGGKDCNDVDPAISSLHSEVCNNLKDDNCNGLIDEMPCSAAQNATCGTALAITAPGNYLMSTVAAPKTFATTCSVQKPSTAHDVVASVTVPSGPNVDLDLWVTSGSSGDVSVAVQGTCGQSASELACGAGVGATQTRTRVRNVPSGTYSVIVTARDETSVYLAVDFLTPTPKPTNTDCSAPVAIAAGVPTTVSIIDPPSTLPSACSPGTGELTYALTLSSTQDVRIYSSTLRGSGVPVVGFRAPSCSGSTDELHCHSGSAIPVFARAVSAGTYVITVAATTPIDANILVQLSAPTTAPPDQLCSSAPAASVDKSLSFDLSNHEDDIKDGCFPGGPTAAYAFDISSPSDVLLVARYPLNDPGAVSLDAPACTTSDKLFCATGTTPVRSAKRNVPTGSYRAVVADSLAQMGTLSTFVRTTTASVAVVGADNCAGPGTLSASGGFYTGDTTSASADFDESCDAGGQPPGGAPDQVLRLDLAKTQHVVFSMEGSVYSTILSVRQGSACPGVELSNGCTAGFSGPRSFLDFPSLAAGTYWVIIDGYAGNKGAWDLDVYVVDP